ncbi:hypothetical protein A3Q56_07052 [Intoshia linei]|uniref:Uncharacterized protein n=1 Tax=Intoshia linei TaxID=1819745 RepID=A0A177AVK4_9BILA|nr:hypothetical protein A3Q56_07052 [Intoshia linei]
MTILTDFRFRKNLFTKLDNEKLKISILFFVLGIYYFVHLCKYQNSQKTYISDNALLPGLARPIFTHQKELNLEIMHYKKLRNMKEKLTFLKEKFDKMQLKNFVQGFQSHYIFNNNTFGENFFVYIPSKRSTGLGKIFSD